MRVRFGIICFALVALTSWAMIGMGLEPDVSRDHGIGGKIIVIGLLGTAFGLLLAGGYAAMISGGGLDWLAIGRGWQHMIAFVCACGAAVAMALASGLYTEPVEQLPAVFQPIIAWTMFGLPVLALAAGLLPLDAAWRDALPAALSHGAQAGIGLFVIVIALGLSAQLVVENVQYETDRAQQEITDAQERDQRFLEEVKAADPVADFGSLLGRTGIHTNPATRELALEKLKSNPNFTAYLLVALRNGWRGEAMIHVAWNDVPEAEKVAPAVRDAIEKIASDARKEMQEAHYLWDDHFDSRSERILAAADRFAGRGVDFVPAVRAFRAAMDEPRTQKIDARCRRNLDAWLKRNGG